MDLDAMRAYVASVEWIFAKTMAATPHEYTLRRKAPGREAEFEAVVMFIRQTGYKKKFKATTYTYIDLDGYCYWTMGAPLPKTILINRARLNQEAAPAVEARRPKLATGQ